MAILLIITATLIVGIALGAWIAYRHELNAAAQIRTEISHLRDVLAGLILRNQYTERRMNELEMGRGERTLWQ